jgi:UDP-2-acetamido-2-deoxy-ribo-hexuluronate aminotransferase
MDFIDLSSQQKNIRKKIEEKIGKIFDSNSYINGPEVRELEQKLAEFCGVKYAVGCSSGTDALLMPLMVYDIKPGDAVFTTPFTFIATAEVIQLLGATPVFVDCEPGTFNIDSQKLEEAVKKIKKENKLKPVAVIPVDIFGQPADYDEINAIASKHGLFVLEDAAQSFGSEYKGRRACSLSQVAATSFYPSKPLGCYGDGGMIFTNDKELYDKLLSIRVHGQGIDKYNNVRIGINGRLDTIQAAVLLLKFEILENEIKLRQNIADKYNNGLSNIVKPQHVKKHNQSAWALYSILHNERDKLAVELQKNGIPNVVYYPKPLHLQDAFSGLGYKKRDFPVCEKICEEVISIPMHPYLSAEDQEKVIQIVNGSK